MNWPGSYWPIHSTERIGPGTKSDDTTALHFRFPAHSILKFLPHSLPQLCLTTMNFGSVVQAVCQALFISNNMHDGLSFQIKDFYYVRSRNSTEEDKSS